MVGATLKERLEQQIKGRIVYFDPLGKYASCGIGGPADIMVLPEGGADVRAALRLCREEGVPYLVLAGGSNLLVRDGGFRGVVLHLEGIFTQLNVAGRRVSAGAGVRLSRLVAFCSKLALGGGEGLAGVPRSVGGGGRGESRAFGGCIADHLVAVRLL